MGPFSTTSEYDADTARRLNLLTQNGKPKMRQMNPNLMGPSGFQLRLEQAHVRPSSQ